jgi:dGTP triphosphohydrolase
MTVLITEYVQAIQMTTDRNKPADINAEAKDEVNIAKQLTWHYVILNNELALSQHGQRKIVGDLFDLLYDVASSGKNLKLFPPCYEKDIRKAETEHGRIRIVADYISGMTEKEVISVHKKIHGIDHGRMI